MARRPAASRTSRAGGGKARHDADSAAAITGDGQAGRPNAPGLRCLARAHAAAAVEALAAVMRDPSATPAARVSAAGALLAWGYGKAGQNEDGRRAAQAGERIVRLVWGGDDA